MDTKYMVPLILVERIFSTANNHKRFYDIDWAVNLWRATGKENLGLPDNRSLELEFEDVPFRDSRDAIRYYTGISRESDSGLQNAIHIIAPLYYAEIKKVELSGRELSVETEFNLVGTKNLRIGYNTEGPDEKSPYFKMLEASTVKPADGTTTIQLKEDAEFATVWLYHTAGYVIDSRNVRTSSIDKIERSLCQENPQLWDEEVRVINDAIISASRTIPDLMTTELGVDSIDVEMLKAMKTLGGDYAEFMPEILKYLSLNMLLSRLARLRILGFITLQPPRKVLLTPHGVDALKLPPSVLSAKVPPEVDKRMAEIRSAFRDGDYDEVTNKSTKLLEYLLRERIETKFKGTLQDIWSNQKLEPYDRASLGTLKEACLKLKVFKENSIADHLISTLLQLRIPMSHEKEEIKPPSDIALLTVGLVEAFLRNWFYLRL